MNYSRPINPLSSLRFLGGGISEMAFALLGSISIPLLLTINPKSLPKETLKILFGIHLEIVLLGLLEYSCQSSGVLSANS